MEQNNRKTEAGNPFFERLKKYVGKQVSVKLKSGGDLKGTLVAVNFMTMNFILEDDKQDFVIRDDISYLSVKRDSK